MAVSDPCSLCGQPIKSPTCPHPWNKSFQEWPQNQVAELVEAIKDGPREK